MRSIKLSLIVLCVFLCSCATTVSLSPENKSKIKTVHVNPSVSIPNDFTYFGSATGGAGMAFGVVGVLAAAIPEKTEYDTLKKLMVENNIKVNTIVKKQFIAKLKDQTTLKETNKNPDVAIDLAIKSYGLSIPNGFSSTLKPVLFIEATMKDRSGQIIWKNHASSTPLSKAPGYRYSEYKQDPHKITEVFTIGSARVIDQLLLKIEQ